MRSRFWLGEIEPQPRRLSRADMIELVPDERVRGLHRHSSEEMALLGGFLPTLYRINNGGR